MTVRVAINGFGRIGRNILRAIAEADRKDIEVVALNDLGPVETNAHLLRYDSVHGRFPGEVTVTGFVLWTAYGVLTRSWPVWASNTVNLVLAATILILRARYGSAGPPRG